MRQFIIAAALVLAAASAQAGETRNLTRVAADETAVTAPPKAVEAAPVAQAATPAETVAPAATPAAVAPVEAAPKYVDRPAAVTPTVEAPSVASAKPLIAQGPKAEKPKHKRYWTEARIIGELHRHGIYW
jgi:hypothetical protein